MNRRGFIGVLAAFLAFGWAGDGRAAHDRALGIRAPSESSGSVIPGRGSWGATGPNRARQGVREGRLLPLEDILASVRPRVPGRVLDVQLSRRDRRDVYRLKILGRDGKVRLVAVDGATARILSVRGGGR